jgi:hypothetical protein
MHSSSLRDSDFQIIADGTSVELCHYFSGYSNTKRLGLFAPNRLEGVGAITLVMAHVTAFYSNPRPSIAYSTSGPITKASPSVPTLSNDLTPSPTARSISCSSPQAPLPPTISSGNNSPPPPGLSIPVISIRNTAPSPTPTWSSAAIPIHSINGLRAYSIRFQAGKPRQKRGDPHTIKRTLSSSPSAGSVYRKR